MLKIKDVYKRLIPCYRVSAADHEAGVLERRGRRTAVVCGRLHQRQRPQGEERPHLGCKWLQGIPHKPWSWASGRRFNIASHDLNHLI